MKFEKLPFEGKTVVRVYTPDEDVVVFEGDDWTAELRHDQDCCESVYLADVCGDLSSLVGKLYMAEVSENYVEDSNSETWTFYRFRSDGGDVVLRWVGESNGYYSESVDVYMDGKQVEL